MPEFTRAEQTLIAAAGAAARQDAVRQGISDPKALDWERRKGEDARRALILAQRDLNLR